MDPICRNPACAVRHSPLWNCSDPRIVRDAINTGAINASHAINTQQAKDAVAATHDQAVQVDAVSPARSSVGGVVRTPNRRSREAYNAYMREYMRKRRVG